MGFISNIINGKKHYLLEWQNTLLEEPINKLIMTEQQLKTQTESRVNNDLRIINDSSKLIENTVKPDVFFQRLQLLEKKAADMVRFEKFISFKGAIPSEGLEEVRDNKQQAIKLFLIRYFNAIYDKSETLKTNKAKLNQYQKFYDSMQPYYEYMDKDNIDYVETKYTAYTELIKKG